MSRAEQRRRGVTTAEAVTADERRNEVKEEKTSFNESSEEGCLTRNADVQQMNNTKDVKGKDKEAKEQKEHRQPQAKQQIERQAKEHTQQQGQELT